MNTQCRNNIGGKKKKAEGMRKETPIEGLLGGKKIIERKTQQ